jgi:hypothetical protein
MTTIQLNFQDVIKKLNEIKQEIEVLSLKEPSDGSLGENKLDFTAKWLEREAKLHDWFLNIRKRSTKTSRIHGIT